jgi:hypothetical protein
MIDVLGAGYIHSSIVFMISLTVFINISPLHDIILRTIQTPHSPNDPINPLFIWQLINGSFMDELHGICGK